MKRAFFYFLLLLTFNVSLSQDKKLLYSSLSLKDKLWVLTNFNSVKRAFDISKSVLITIDSLSKNDLSFYNKNIESGKCDAFRHLLWMYNLSSNIGVEKARRIGNIYENYNAYVYKVNPYSGYDKASMDMDLYNNEVGIYLFLKFGKDNNLITTYIKEAIENGYVKIIFKDKDFNNLDESNKIIETQNWKGKWENQRCLINSNKSICE